MIKIGQQKGIIRTSVNRGQGGTYWLAIRDETTIKEEVAKLLLSMGYRLFRGLYTKQILSKNIPNIYTELSTLESQLGVQVDKSGLDTIRDVFEKIQKSRTSIVQPQVQEPIKPEIPMTPEEQKTTEQKLTTPDVAEGDVSAFLAKMREEMGKTDASDQAKMMGTMIADQLENLAKSTDEAKKDKFVKEFMNFSTKFWKYSWLNQMLIFFQTRGKADYVKGAKQWETVGRKITATAKPIFIIAPQFASASISEKALPFVLRFVQVYISKLGSNEHDLNVPENIRKFLGFAKRQLYPSSYAYLLRITQQEKFGSIDEVEMYLEDKVQVGQGDKAAGGRVTGFKDVNVYDIADTAEISGWEAKHGQPPLREPPKEVWQSKYNTPSAATTALLRAALSLANEKKVKVNLEADLGQTGGLSRGEEIEINKESKGIRQLATTIHEIAHSILHFEQGEGRSHRIPLSRKEAEIDAESTAYIVMLHLSKMGDFEFDPEYIPRYLLLHGADSQAIRMRKENISKAVQEVIKGIQKYIMTDEKPITAKSVKNWYKLSKSLYGKFEFDSTFIPIVYVGDF